MLLASAIVLAGLIFWLGRGSPPQSTLTVYCAAGLREPMEAIRKTYEAEHGTTVSIQYGGSNTLLANLKLSEAADLFLPADDSYIAAAQQDHLLAETLPVARIRPVLVAQKGSLAAIKTLDDLLAKNMRISMTDPDAAATGKLVRESLQRAGKWDEFKSHVTVFKGAVTEVAADLQVGAADVGILWNAMLKQLPDLEEVPLAELADVTAHVVVGVVAKSKHLGAARQLADYIAARDKGQRIFQEAGFVPATEQTR